MSQNSLVLPTTGQVSGLVMTQKTNDSIDTLATYNSGPTAPASPQAHMLWMDTAFGALKQRNASNTAWDVLSKARPKNYVVGGDFGTNPWQISTATTGITNSGRAADRFILDCISSGTWTLQRVADAPTFAQSGMHMSHCLEARCTAADVSVGAAEFCHLSQWIEGFDYRNIYQKPQLISFWIKASTVGDYGVSIRSSGYDRSFVGKITVNAAGTWERKTVPITTAPVGGVWGMSSGAGAGLSISLVDGANYRTGTLNEWQSADLYAPTTQVNLAAAVNNYVRLADIRLIEGTVDLTPEYQSAAEVLTQCYRYYLKLPANGFVGASFGSGLIYSSILAIYHIAFPVMMQSVPAVSVSSPGDFTVLGEGTSYTPTGISAAERTLSGARLQANISAAALGASIIQSANANAFIAFDAEPYP